MNVVHLIRHGEPATGWGEPGGVPDPGLSFVGCRQAEVTAQRLLTLTGDQRPTRIFTSPLRRCQETAAAFAAASGLSPIIENAVAEIPTPAGVEGPDRATWLRAAMGGTWAQVEGIDGAAWRDAVVAALLKAEGTAVFTHFVAINAAIGAASGSEAVLSFRPAPASITTLRIEDGGLFVERLGEALDEPGRVL